MACRTPLIAAVASNFVNLGLDCYLMFVLGWGVAGAGIATTASQYASFAVMYYLMVKKGILQQRHMARVPSLGQVLPILKVSHTESVTQGCCLHLEQFNTAYCSNCCPCTHTAHGPGGILHVAQAIYNGVHLLLEAWQHKRLELRFAEATFHFASA